MKKCVAEYYEGHIPKGEDTSEIRTMCIDEFFSDFGYGNEDGA